MYKLKDDVEFISPDEITDDIVIKEIEMIKEYFSKSEIDLLLEALNNYELEGNDPSCCIYGIMTGHCNSNRSLEFIQTLPIIVQDESHDALKDNKQYSDSRLDYFYTPLEKYIMDKVEDKGRLFSYTDSQTQNWIYKLLTE